MFITVKRTTLILIVSVLAVAIALGVVLPDGSISAYAKKRSVPIYSVETDRKVVALSFDAAYGADKTDGIMEILSRYDVPATFFLVGFWVSKYPDVVKKISDCGFEIGSHSDSHAHMSKMNEGEIRVDISASARKITAITGKPVNLFRAPYGDYDDLLVDTARSMGYHVVQWSVDSLDWKNISTDHFVNRVLSKAHNGAIVLMHNNSDYVLSALPKVIEGLKSQGYTFSSVGDMIMTDNYYVDNNGVQRRNV